MRQAERMVENKEHKKRPHVSWCIVDRIKDEKNREKMNAVCSVMWCM